MSRIIAVGDLHFGVRNSSPLYSDYQLKWIREELFKLLQKDDYVYILGDIFDNRTSLSPLILNIVEDVFTEMCSIVKPSRVRIIVGNHDTYFRNTKKIHSLRFLRNLGCKIYDKITEEEIDGKKLLILPWITKDDRDEAIKVLATNNYDICMGHLEINGFQMTKGIVEKNGLSVENFANCKLVLSGHFHLRGLDKNIKYVGTPYEMDWGDYLSDKGIDIVDIDTLQTKFVESVNIPRHIKVKTKDYTIDKITKELISNNFVEVRFHDRITELEQINIIEKVNSLNPLSVAFDDEKTIEVIENVEIHTSIKDTMGFLKEYIDIIELPQEIDKQLLVSKLVDIYKRTQT